MRSSTEAALRSASVWTAGSFVALVVLGAFSMSSAINAVVGLTTQGSINAALSSLALGLAGLCVAVAGTAYLLYRLDLPNGRIRRRVRAFEVGWVE